jgi:hypothetical protein
MPSVETRRFRDSPGLSSCGLISRCGHDGRSATPARALARRSRPNQDFSFARNARRPSSSRSRSLNSRPLRRLAIGRGRHRSLTPTACAKSTAASCQLGRQNAPRTVPAHPALGCCSGGRMVRTPRHFGPPLQRGRRLRPLSFWRHSREKHPAHAPPPCRSSTASNIEKLQLGVGD